MGTRFWRHAEGRLVDVPRVKTKARWNAPRRCVYCGEVGPRCRVSTGWAHKRCIPHGAKRFDVNVRRES